MRDRAKSEFPDMRLCDLTSGGWIDVLSDATVRISMDGRGRLIDSRMIERLWRSLKYECVYLNAFETGSEAHTGVRKWPTYYNSERPHSTHDILTPNEAYPAKQNQWDWQPD